MPDVREYLPLLNLVARINTAEQLFGAIAAKKDISMVVCLIETASIEVLLNGYNGSSFLHYVIEGFGDAAISFLPLLVSVGININIRNLTGKTPLFIAVDRNCLAVASWLLAHGADMAIADSCQVTILHLISKNNALLMLQLFCEYGDMAVDARDDQRLTPLSWAVGVGATTVLPWLLEKNTLLLLDVNFGDNTFCIIEIILLDARHEQDQKSPSKKEVQLNRVAVAKNALKFCEKIEQEITFSDAFLTEISFVSRAEIARMLVCFPATCTSPLQRSLYEQLERLYNEKSTLKLSV